MSITSPTSNPADAGNSASAGGVCARDAATAQWFSEQVQPHERQLRNFLHGSFPLVRDVDDVVQESYLRIWKARTARPIASAKAFLFASARNLALDILRRGRRAPVDFAGDLAALDVIEDKPTVAQILTQRELLGLLSDAIVALPDRTRTIVILHKLKSIPQAEVARQLGITEKAVERQVARGIELCRNHLRSHGHEFL